MDLRPYTHADASHVRSLLLDIRDEVYAREQDVFHSRGRFSYFVDLWSKREDWLCMSGWEHDLPVGYAYGSRFRPGGWWAGATRPAGVRGRIFALSELMILPKWQGTGRAKLIHDALLDAVEADFVTLQVETRKPRVQALYESWGYEQQGRSQPYEDSPCYAVMVKDLNFGGA